MLTEKNAKRIAGLVVLLIASIVYYFSVERTGSLWDCGEFVLAAYKLQVVHPPGAPLFIIVGRMFTFIAELFSDDPSSIAFSVNLMSGLCTAFAAMFICWSTFLLGKIALVGRAGVTSQGERIALMFSGVVAGLAAAFATSVWFSAVEGEVYAMSTFFTAMTLWAMVEWYHLPNEPTHDRWVLFALFSAAMSIGVHLLSLLTFPALVLFYYFKKFKNPTLKGAGISVVASLLLIGVINKFIIAGIPGLWQTMELFTVNTLGLPVHSGLIPTLLIIGALIFFGLRYAHKHRNGYWQQIFVGFSLVIIGFSTIGVVLVRANAHPPINMNEPTDAMRLLPYLNREQYGERPILYGPHFNASPTGYDFEDRYGLVGDKYEKIDVKITPKYRSSDKILFPRVSHNDANRKRLYQNMWGISKNPSMAENIGFFLKYQIGWMYMRYFMWNFAGRQNGYQGFSQTNIRDGNWLSGIKPLDEMRLHNMDKMPDTMKNNKARNRFYLIPLLLGILGMVFHFKNKRGDFLTIAMLFIITGVGITVFANSPPNEPRERDYIFVGSFITFAIWVGMGVLFLYRLLKDKANMSGLAPALIAGALCLSAPALMGFENYSNHSRKDIRAARDYAANFLRGLEENAILFTFGDNDTYPLWYVQEVEGVRTDVRVVNLSLIGVDWYINHQRYAMNDSPPIDYTIPEDSYRGSKRNQVLFHGPNINRPMSALQALKFCGERHPLPSPQRELESYLPSKNLFIPVDRNRAVASGWIDANDPTPVVDKIPFNFGKAQAITKGELAVMDIVATNVYKRPVYFNTTIMPNYIKGFEDYLQLEGMALRVVPFRSNREQGFGIFGYGRIDAEKSYDVIMNKWEWGNFDEKDLYVDDSYRATQQAMRLSMARTAQTLQRKGDTKRAVEVAEKYFEAFPHMNFSYDMTVVPFLQILVNGKAESAKTHMKILAEEGKQYMEFFQSLDPDDLAPGTGFGAERNQWNQTIQQVMFMTNSMDDEFKAEIQAILGPYVQTPTRN